ncbi:MAG: primosomal protein N', partial [Bacteroidota bacterium]
MQSESLACFIDVLLPLPLPGYFTYRVPFALADNICIGQRVIVQFGRSKIYTAIICRIHDKPPQGYEAKYILSLLDESPVVNETQMKFWEWMSGYYLCHPGEVMNAALPSGFKLSSQTRISMNPEVVFDAKQLTKKEILLFEALKNR